MISELQRGQYNANRAAERHDANEEDTQLNRKYVTGSKYKRSKKSKKELKKSRQSVQRSLKDIGEVFDKHQKNFNGQIDLRDEWRSKDYKENPGAFVQNRHLARQWKTRTRIREKKILTKFKNNADRITSMVFEAHRHCWSFRSMESFRHSVTNCLLHCKYNQVHCKYNLYIVNMICTL